MVLTREQILAADRLLAILAKMSDPAATVPEAATFHQGAVRLAARIPNGPAVLDYWRRAHGQ